MVSSEVTSFITMLATATHDGGFRLTDQDIPFYDANFHIAAHAALYGDMTAQLAPAAISAVISFKNANIKDIWFKNQVPGDNIVVICVATVPTKYVSESLGLIS